MQKLSHGKGDLFSMALLARQKWKASVGEAENELQKGRFKSDLLPCDLHLFHLHIRSEDNLISINQNVSGRHIENDACGV